MEQRRRRRDVLAVVTAVVLLLLGGVSAWAVHALSRSTAEVTVTTARVRAYQDLQEAVASQAFAEAGYRRSPSPGARLRLDASVEDVSRSVGEIRVVAPPGEGAMLSYLELLNDRYVAETRRALAGGGPAGTSEDDRVAGPALDAVQDLVHAAISTNQADADAAVQRQRTVVGTLTVVLPAVLLIAGAALTLAVRAQRTEAAVLERLAEEAQRQARHDPLTGLANRTGFDLAVDDLLQDPRGRRCLLLVDLDHFKGVNDAYGHAAGDAVLVEVSARMTGVLRPGDVLARLGGDEFAVLLRGCDEPLRVGEKLCRAVSQPMAVGEAVVVPTISVGVASYPADGTDRASLLHAADLALYRAKSAGRARVSG